MVETKYHHSVGVRQDAFVDKLLVAGLVDTLEHRDWVVGDLADNVLKAECRAVEQFKRPCDALKEIYLIPFRRFVVRPGDSTNLSHRREPIVHNRGIAVGFPRVAPGPIDADPSLARR